MLRSRKEAGTLLAPLFYEFCCRLWYFAGEFSPEREALLFMARGGLRLHYLFELFLQINGLKMSIPRFPFWISRFAAVELTFADNPESAISTLVREFAANQCRELAFALLPEPLYPEKTALLDTLPAELAETPVNEESVRRLFAADCSFSEALRGHFQEQHDIGAAILKARFGTYRILHLVDTGWFGSILNALQTGFPAWRWDAFYFGRWNYRGEVPRYFDDITGVMIDAVGMKERDSIDVLLEYHHLIEAVLEPDFPSVEYYLPDGSSNAAIADADQRVAGGEGDELWSGVKDYFRQAPSSNLHDCAAATGRALKQWRRLLRYPSAYEARLLEVPPRSADFGKHHTTAVFNELPDSGVFARWRSIRHSLWPAGNIAVASKHGILLRQLIWRLGRKAGNYRGAV